MPNLDNNKLDISNYLYSNINSNELLLNYYSNTKSNMSKIKIKKVIVEIFSHRLMLYSNPDDAEVHNLGYKNNKMYRTPRDGLYTSMFVDVYAKHYNEYVKYDPVIKIYDTTTNSYREVDDLSFLDEQSNVGEKYTFYLVFNDLQTNSIKIINNDKIFPAKIIVDVVSGIFEDKHEYYTYFIPPNKSNLQVPVTWCLPYAIDSKYKKISVSITAQSNSVSPPHDKTTTYNW